MTEKNPVTHIDAQISATTRCGRLKSAVALVAIYEEGMPMGGATWCSSCLRRYYGVGHLTIGRRRQE